MLEKKLLQQSLTSFWKNNQPSSYNEFAEVFSQAIVNFLSTLIPASTTLLLAKESMRKELLFSQNFGDFTLIEKSLFVCVSEVSKGMAPTFVSVATPMISFGDIWDKALRGDDVDNVIKLFVDRFYNYLILQKAINASSGVVINWN